MKSICTLTLAASLAASAAYSGNLSDPVIATPPAAIIQEVEAIQASNPAPLLPVLIFAAMVAAALISD